MNEKAFALSGYKSIQPLGEGGTAEVYLVINNATGRRFAAKFPRTAEACESQKFAALLQREFDLIGGLKYPGLARVYELSETDDETPVLLLEYCPHKSLRAMKLPLSNPELMNILSSIAINLYYLELLGISHGDLKPDNIFLNRTNPGNFSALSPLTKICDFSLGLRRSESTDSRLGIGTIGFIAPETLDDGTLNHSADLFALGVIGYLLATGQHPFGDKDHDPVRINSRIKEFNPEAPAAVNTGISSSVSDIIMKLLNKEPDKRFDNGWEVCTELEKLGAEFRFRRMVRPRYLFPLFKGRKAEEVLSGAPFDFEESTVNLLSELSDNDIENIRRVMEVNFSCNKLLWKDGTLALRSNRTELIWPLRLKRQLRKGFAASACSEKRKMIKAAVAGGITEARRIGLINQADSGIISPAMLRYLSINISAATSRRLAKSLAELSRRKADCTDLTAELYLKAGNLKQGYHYCIEAANNLVKENIYERAYGLLRKLIDLCRSNNDVPGHRKATMELADIQKRAGDSSKAELSYKEIIATYENAESDKLLAETYKDLGDVYKMKQDYDNGIANLEKAVEIYTELDDQLELSHTLNNIGNVMSIKADYEGALSHYRQALKIQRNLNSQKDIASTLNNMSPSYYAAGRLDRTLRLLRLALGINREIGDALETARVLNNMGFIYSEQGRFDKAVDSLMESQELNRRSGIKKELLFNLENLTEIMLSAGRLKESFQYLKEGIALAEEMEDKPHRAFTVSSMGAVLKRMGYFGQSAKKLMEALKLGREIVDENHIIICLIRLAGLYIALGDKKMAGKYLDDAIAKAKTYSDKRAILSTHILAGQLQNKLAEFDYAYDLASSLKLDREKAIIRLHQINGHITQNSPAIPHDWIEESNGYFGKSPLDIEKAFCFNIMGRYYLASGDYERAEGFFVNANKQAQDSYLMPEIIESSRFLGRLNAIKHEYEEAFKWYRHAMDHLKKMAEDIDDTNLRKIFLASDHAVEMLNELNELRQKITGKREAGLQ